MKVQSPMGVVMLENNFNLICPINVEEEYNFNKSRSGHSPQGTRHLINSLNLFAMPQANLSFITEAFLFNLVL